MDERTLMVIRAGGLAQLGIALASLAVPVVLGWRAEVARLTPLTRAVFWIYAGYILCSHLAFGALAAGRPELLADGSPLARVVCAFIAAWWGARLVLQFTVMDRTARPPGAWARAAEALMVAGFAGLTLVFAGVALR